MSRSLILARPPMHSDDLDPPPASILLDRRGYIDERTNAATAEGVTSGGKRIKVTFWMVHPPRCSCFTVYSPDLEDSAFGGLPMLLSTEDDLALLRVPICPLGRDGVASNNDHFVYQAGNENKPPSLDLIPRAPGRFFFDDKAGLLRCRARNMYFIVLLCWAFRVGHYKLHLYNSKTETCSTKLTYLAASSEQKLLYTHSSKVINIGGELGSIGWVDLWRGILICDVFKYNPELRYIPLPSPLVPRPLNGPPLYFRDIIVVEGYIKYFEMCLDVRPEGWKATTWGRKDSWNEWKKDHVVEVSKEPAHANPDQQEAQTKEQPTLKGFYSGYPALSLHDADVVYIMDRHNLDDTNVTLVAVDMRKQTLKGVAGYYSPRPLGYSSIYFGSGISKHLRRTSTIGNAATETSKRETLQFGNQGVPRKNVQSQMSFDGTHCKCRGRRGRCKQADKLEVLGKNDRERHGPCKQGK